MTDGFLVGMRNVLCATDFEEANDAGWTHGQVATQDDLQRGGPQGSAGDPSAAYSGRNGWANDLGASGRNGAYENDGRLGPDRHGCPELARVP